MFVTFAEAGTGGQNVMHVPLQLDFFGVSMANQ